MAIVKGFSFYVDPNSPLDVQATIERNANANGYDGESVLAISSRLRWFTIIQYVCLAFRLHRTWLRDRYDTFPKTHL